MNKAAGEAGPNPAAGANPQAQRKIIYNATLELIVKNLDTAGESLQQIVKEHNAYVARSEVQGVRNARRRGTWTVRVPVNSGERMSAAAACVAKACRIERSTMKSSSSSRVMVWCSMASESSTGRIVRQTSDWP